MMLLINDKNNQIKNVLLLLELSEAEELKTALEDLIKIEKLGGNSSHHHISNSDYSQEITVSIYNDKTKNEYAKMIKELL